VTAQARVNAGVPAGGEFTATAHTDDVVTLTPPPANPAAVFAAAVGTDKDPNSIPWPETPDNAVVEVFVSDDDLNDVLNHSGYEGDEADAYSQVYASLNLVHDKDCDFWGITADGKEEVIALGIREYEQAVDPYNHENLRYRDGYTNPMPPYLAAQKETEAKRLEASAALLAEAGITVELEDLRRGYYRLNRGTFQTVHSVRLQIADFQGPKLIETRNWREATAEHFAGSWTGPGTTGRSSASGPVADLKDKAYQEMYARRHQRAGSIVFRPRRPGAGRTQTGDDYSPASRPAFCRRRIHRHAHKDPSIQLARSSKPSTRSSRWPPEPGSRPATSSGPSPRPARTRTATSR
jgi:hypothetical protein